MGHLHLMVADPEAQKKLWVDILGAKSTHTGTLEMLRLPGDLPGDRQGADGADRRHRRAPL